VRAGIRARNLILKARSAHETRVEEELVSPAGILEIYLLLYVFVKPRVFPPASTRPRLYDLPVRPSIVRPASPPSPSLVILESIFRVIWTVASLRQFSRRLAYTTRESSEILCRVRSSNIAHCGTFIEPVDSLGFSPETREDLLPRTLGQLKRRES